MIGKYYSEKVFPHICEFALSRNFLKSYRQETLQETDGKVLEIGFGTGLNLPHYPKTVKQIDAVDINPSMHRLARKRVLNSKIDVTNHVLSGEELPMESQSYDCVASTFTLCSIFNVSKGLSEVFRVLKPGGIFVFLEHGLSKDLRVQAWQQRLNKLQNIIGDGCHLNREIDKLILMASFEIIEMKNIHLPVFPRFIGHCFQGIATKKQN